MGNNSEVDRLRRYTGTAILAGSDIEYYGLKSNFQPEDPGWNILGYFSKPLQRGVAMAADLIFEENNDLVVDTVSMDQFADRTELPAERVHNFCDSPLVFHTNYFRQPQTIAHISKCFKIAD